MEPIDIARLITEDPDIAADFFHGYRSYGDRTNMLRILENGIAVPDTMETYWSWDPILYYWYNKDATPGYKKGRLVGNIVEVRFTENDPNVGGFGDGQPLYAYMVARDKEWVDKHHMAKAENLLDELPPAMKKSFLDLQQQITGDPKWRGDWMFAGILPDYHKQAAVDWFRDARRYLSAVGTASSHEFNYVGPIISFGDPNNTSIVGIYELYKDTGEIYKAYYTCGLSKIGSDLFASHRKTT